MSFQLLHVDGGARRGRLVTPHGTVETPTFMPVGTQATVKTMLMRDVESTGAQVVLGNTYHLMLRPGADRVAAFGGLHRFMNWPHTILTDSGGFQVMSLSALRKIDADGVTFKSHVDGSMHRLTPESAVDIQLKLGADIQMQLDECVRLPADAEAIARSVTISLDWGARARRTFLEAGTGRLQFGIVQGGTDPSERARSAEGLVAIGFDGYAIGGLAVGEPQADMFATIDVTEPSLPATSARYLMGVGTPGDLIGAVARGIDMFDCVMPTREGRHGMAYTSEGKINLKNARFATDDTPLDPAIDCHASREYSRGYLHHLVKVGEPLAATLISWHNIAYYQRLMADLRDAIAAGRFAEERARLAAIWGGGEDT
ncbi:tRNA guanosine(34) transglycosylase Tgt [Acuticoccus sediminis]|uniref:Queuine tRNA-ribosyltransferase n=1 Tax=Acuticoccus sediminis TaxID=2184697 RepID=A0A8B2NHL1_9HYPH|nr:tRNA guanosine(34) transglycosylase Tgt [Acuticoccus sediminis]RAH98971.1 tRNA guanosine(34) transglycosylase Tgt [Acuticoccus sediminis]